MRGVLPAALAGLLALVSTAANGAPAAPGFRVKLLDSARTIDSRDLLGKKVLVLRFQASYCKPCARESAAFGRLVQRYRRRGVEFLALHVQDTVADTRRFVRAQKVTYPVALDLRLTIGNQFGFKGTPYTVVVDLKGEMVAGIHGLSAVTRLPRILDAALPEDGSEPG
ncbi:MAG TPA: TlpA disulfide reductase family protein [Methylomirabilota bacterium]|nr:TlpA disulfide reductase family protein [Methylomirabilota bacterium]